MSTVLIVACCVLGFFVGIPIVGWLLGVWMVLSLRVIDKLPGPRL